MDLGDKERETVLRYARVLSWHRKYREAEKVYDQLIQQDPNDWKVQREKARMLGWDRQYSRAIREYKAMLKKFPDNECIKLEGEAKEAYYDGHDQTAILKYERLISIEPDNLEARFDLAQVYSRQSMWPQAHQAYAQTLDIYPGHFRAREADEKVTALYGGPNLSLSYQFDKQESSARQVDVTQNQFGLDVEQWITPRLTADFRYNYENLSFEQVKISPDASRFLGGFQYVDHPRGDIGVMFGALDFFDSRNDFWLYDVNAHVRTFDVATLDLTARRREFIQNFNTWNSRIASYDEGVALDYFVTRRWFVRPSYMFSAMTDNNEKHTLGADTRYRILWEPTALDVGYRYEQWFFERFSPIYFSPSDFRMHTFYVDWKHYLNKNELFWGTNDTYYNLQYAFEFDSQNQTANTFGVGLHHDFTKKLSLHADYFFTRGTVYQEDAATVSLKYTFGGRKK
jgi:tetratricopeptide (TPR) repeat protein